MIRHDTYSVDFIFGLMDAQRVGKITLPSGARFKPNSARLVLFKTKGTRCVTCGIDGTVFALESVGPETPHINLYALDEKGNEVLMTKDHIMPKARGGRDVQENFQTMCVDCNGKKGDKVGQ